MKYLIFVLFLLGFNSGCTIQVPVEDPEINLNLGDIFDGYEEFTFCGKCLYDSSKGGFCYPMQAEYCAVHVFGMNEMFARCLICETFKNVDCEHSTRNACQEILSGDYGTPSFGNLTTACEETCVENTFTYAYNCRDQPYEQCSVQVAALLTFCLEICWANE